MYIYMYIYIYINIGCHVMGGIDLPKTGILDSLASKSTCRLAEEI